MGVQRHNVLHFKGLIVLYLDDQAQGRDTTFIMGHALLKKAILQPVGIQRRDVRHFKGLIMLNLD